MRKHLLSIMTASALLAFGLAACGSGNGGGSSSSGNIQIWDGYTQVEAKAFAHLLKEWNAKHPDEKVTSSFVNNDFSLPKLLTAVKGGSQPDIAYVYGSWAPNVAQIPQVVNLTKVVQQPGVNWDDFWTGERDVATVDGKVIGIPALVDNLAVVYNKTLFAKAHLPLPSATWTWNDFVADAQKLTDASSKQYGTAYVTPGGAILNAGNTKAAFDSAAGLQSLTTLQTMAVKDHSMYLDQSDSEYGNLFNSGKIGMLVTGPWDLATFPNVQYGVQIMPAFPGASGGHQTISGPDNWVVFNNGSARVTAAEQFLLWLTSPAQVKYFSMKTGDPPPRASVAGQPSVVKAMDAPLPGGAGFVANLSEVKQARPQITMYPKIST